jgi:hypothetical protein
MSKITRPLSPENAALLRWKLGREMTPGLKVTLTAEALGALLDAARVDEQANILERQLDVAIGILKTDRAQAETREAMAEAAVSPKH